MKQPRVIPSSLYVFCSLLLACSIAMSAPAARADGIDDLTELAQAHSSGEALLADDDIRAMRVEALALLENAFGALNQFATRPELQEALPLLPEKIRRLVQDITAIAAMPVDTLEKARLLIAPRQTCIAFLGGAVLVGLILKVLLVGVVLSFLLGRFGFSIVLLIVWFVLRQVRRILRIAFLLCLLGAI